MFTEEAMRKRIYGSVTDDGWRTLDAATSKILEKGKSDTSDSYTVEFNSRTDRFENASSR